MRQPSTSQKDLRKARPKVVCVVSSLPRCTVMDGAYPWLLLIRVSHVRVRRTSVIDIHYTTFLQ
jgi:hypothetical protein